MTQDHVKPKRRILWPAALAIVIIGLALSYSRIAQWAGGDRARSVDLAELVQPGQAEGFNVLLITLDTTRPDRLGCYGYEPARTPAIDSLVDNGVRFDDAVTCVPITLPSHCAIMTGKYPPTLGVRANGIHQLAAEHETLAELMRDKGYRTAAFIGAFVLDKRFGLDQGFETYDFELGAFDHRRRLALENERRAAEVTQSAVKWINQHDADQPFFIWTHYFDPHYPYDSPLADLPNLADRPYDAEIAYVDQQLKRLFSALDNKGVRDKTLIVLTTDHGESLYEHDEPGHAVFVYDSTIRAALILSCPALFDRAYRVSDRVVGTVDILPTLAELLNLRFTGNVDGVSLLDKSPPSDRAMYIESYYPQVTLSCSPLVGLRRHQDKYIQAPRPEYYDLASDPHELTNQLDRGDDVSMLRRRLDEMLAGWSESGVVSQAAALDEANRQRLESLGYIHASSAGSVDESCDPKDRVHLINRMSEVLELSAVRKFDEAEPLAIQLIDESPGWVAPVRRLAANYVETSQLQKAKRVLQDFTQSKPDSEMLVRLAEIHLMLSEWSDCEEVLKAAEILDPLLGAVPMIRGDALYAQGKYALAVKQYERAIEIDPLRVGPEARKKLAETQRLVQERQP